MQRRRAALLAALLVGGVLAMAPTSPASASIPNVCTGAGSFIVSPGLFYPAGAPQVFTTGLGTTVLFHHTHRVAGWSFGVSTGACTSGGSVAANGILQGYCGHSTGAGVTTTGHLIQWFSLGGYMWFTNGIIGGMYYTPDTLAGSSCSQTSLASSGASSFRLVGSWIPTNCPPTSDLLATPFSKGLTSQFFPLSFWILDPTPNPLWHVIFHLPHVHWSIHGCLFPTFLK